MRPIPIPDDLVPADYRRQVVAGPSGDLTGPIPPVEAMIGHLPASGQRTISVLIALEEGDLEKLQADGRIWLTFLGRIPPFDVQTVG